MDVGERRTDASGPGKSLPMCTDLFLLPWLEQGPVGCAT